MNETKELLQGLIGQTVALRLCANAVGHRPDFAEINGVVLNVGEETVHLTIQLSGVGEDKRTQITLQGSVAVPIADISQVLYDLKLQQKDEPLIKVVGADPKTQQKLRGGQ